MPGSGEAIGETADVIQAIGCEIAVVYEKYVHEARWDGLQIECANWPNSVRGPLIRPAINDQQKNSFDVTCRKPHRFLILHKIQRVNITVRQMTA